MDEEEIWHDHGDLCPGTYYYFNETCSHEGKEQLKYYFVLALAGLVSSGASIIGCSLMMLAYYRFRDFRTGSRRVATYLALSNFFLAASSAVGFFNSLWYGINANYESSSCWAYSVICTVQSFGTWTSALASFTWTTILAVYLYLVLVRKSIVAANRPRLWTVYWLVSVALPLLALLPMLVTGYLGYSPYAAGGGCFITTVVNSGGNITFGFININTALLVTIKSIELLSYILVVGLFTSILCHLRKPTRGLDEEGYTVHPKLYSNLRKEWKLAVIPCSFVLLRIWGTIAVFLSIGLYHSGDITPDGCVSGTVYSVFYVLSVLQAIGDPGQGWANTILFVFLSPAVRQRLLKCCCKSRRFLKICQRPGPSSSASVDYEPFRSTSPIEQCVNHPRVLGLSGTNSEMSSPVAVPRRNSRRSSFVGSIDTSDYGVQFPSSPSF